MGCNDPDLFNKITVERYINDLSRRRARPAELAIRKEMKKSKEEFEFRPGIIQRTGMMAAALAVCQYVEMETRALGRQHDMPINAFDDGTHFGLTAAAMASGMDENNGTVITVDIMHRAEAEKFWEELGIRDRIDYRTAALADGGGSIAILKQLVADTRNHNSFDIAFIDGPKPNYLDVYELLLTLMRPGGRILMDNIILSGLVADPDIHEPNPDALRAVNDYVINDQRVHAVPTDFDDGLMIVEKRGDFREWRKAAQARIPQP